MLGNRKPVQHIMHIMQDMAKFKKITNSLRKSLLHLQYVMIIIFVRCVNLRSGYAKRLKGRQLDHAAVVNHIINKCMNKGKCGIGGWKWIGNNSQLPQLMKLCSAWLMFLWGFQPQAERSAFPPLTRADICFEIKASFRKGIYLFIIQQITPNIVT